VQKIFDVNSISGLCLFVVEWLAYVFIVVLDDPRKQMYGKANKGSRDTDPSVIV
jgi:hypothetical protein